MAFETLSAQLDRIFSRLRSKGKLTEGDVDEALKEVRRALLNADVHFKVVKQFIASVRERAVGEEVFKSLTPAQQVIKIVNEELTHLLGDTVVSLARSSAPRVLLLCGLQGSGKTTTAAKLGLYLREHEHRQVLLAACDLLRPAAIDQLEQLGNQLSLAVFANKEARDAVAVAQAAWQEAKRNAYDDLIVDTAGRLHIDEDLMRELAQIKQALKPAETLLVVDAMTGEDAVTVAERFVQEIGISGVILTKLDGDTRGGAALSIRAVAQVPIKFVGVGEKPSALEPFYPDRMASRILGMGDVLSLIEKASQEVDEQKAVDLSRRARRAELTLDDFLEQIGQLRKMGSMEQVLGMLPGMGRMKELKNVQIDEKELKHVEAIVRSMTKEERAHPEILNASRRRRIANGSGTTVSDVNRLIKQFEEMGKLLKKVSKMPKKGGRSRALPFRLP